MGDDVPGGDDPRHDVGDLGRRAYDPNGLVVRRGTLSVEAHGRTAILILCTMLIMGAVIYESREIQRQVTATISEHEAQYQRGMEAARAMIEDFGRQRRMEHQAVDRRLDILSCAALMTDAERRWARDQRAITWDNRCPWITPEPK